MKERLDLHYFMENIDCCFKVIRGKNFLGKQDKNLDDHTITQRKTSKGEVV